MISMIRLRNAKPADARAIARIHVETWRTTYPGMLPDRALIDMNIDGKARSWRSMLEHPEAAGSVLVAEESEDGATIGFASAAHNRQTTLSFAGEVQTLYVLPDWQNQGIGRILLEGCFARLRERGLESAVVWVLADNPARFFYERMGGKRAGERDENLWGVTLHEIAYGWSVI
jgi:ribosomal protein S18 acetylase RimI-like enzyme